MVLVCGTEVGAAEYRKLSPRAATGLEKAATELDKQSMKPARMISPIVRHMMFEVVAVRMVSKSLSAE